MFGQGLHKQRYKHNKKCFISDKNSHGKFDHPIKVVVRGAIKFEFCHAINHFHIFHNSHFRGYL